VKKPKKKPAHRASRKKSARPTSSSAKRLVNIRELGDAIHLKERRIHMLRHEGLPQVAPGKFDLRACLRWYVRFLQNKIAERANGLGSSTTAVVGAAKNTLLAVGIEMKEIELAEKRERLISADRVRKDTAKIIAAIRRRILALSPKIAIAVVGERDIAVSMVKVDRCLKDALAQLAEFDPDDIEAVAPASTARSRPQ
jgi:hypothetical protein